MDEESILPSFLCPITQSCMKDPVSLETGHTYERKAIDTWFDKNSTDPNTNMHIGKKMTANYALKNAIGEFAVFKQKFQKLQMQVETEQLLAATREEQDRNETRLLEIWFRDVLENLSIKSLSEIRMMTRRVQRWHQLWVCRERPCDGIESILREHIGVMASVGWDVEQTVSDSLPIEFSEKIKQCVRKYARVSMLETNRFTSRKWMMQLVELFEFFHKQFQICFRHQNYPYPNWVQTAMKKAFEVLVNQDDQFSRYLCQYIDAILTTKENEFREILVFEKLRTAFSLAALAHDLSVFEQYYHELLAHRLLSKSSPQTLMLEAKCIVILRPLFGYQFANKLEGMLDNVMHPAMVIPSSKDTTIELTVGRNGHWPETQHVSFTVPAELRPSFNALNHSFRTRYPRRKLFWSLHYGRSRLNICMQCKGDCPEECKWRYDFVVTPHQMLILLLFNESSILRLGDIIKRTGISNKTIAPHLQSLVRPEMAILSKMSDDQFMINTGYSSSQKQVVVPLPDEAEHESGLENNQWHQQHQIDECIRRVMKRSRKVKHTFLMAEVTSLVKLRFIPKPSQIRKRIEIMLEKEDYLARDPWDSSFYVYIH